MAIDWNMIATRDEIIEFYAQLGSVNKVAEKLGVSVEAMFSKMVKDHIPYFPKEIKDQRFDRRLKSMTKKRRKS
jgi:hypothetical protein